MRAPIATAPASPAQHRPTTQQTSPSTQRKRTVQIWHARVGQAESPIFSERLHALLDAAELRRLDALRVQPARDEYLFAHALCRLALSRQAPVPPRAWRFERTPYGRPEVVTPELPAPLFFNLSHSRGFVACAISDAPLLGVDVEQPRPDIEFHDLARRHFSPSEVADLARCAYDQQRQGFFELWVLKEAYIKALGKGMSEPLEGFSIWRGAQGIGVRRADTAIDRATHWRFHLGTLGDDCPMAVAVGDDEPFELVTELHDGGDLLREYANTEAA